MMQKKRFCALASLYIETVTKPSDIEGRKE